jgi:hypothetical protein
MFMKNSLNRLFQANRNKKLFKSTQAGTQMQFTDQLRDEIEAKLLALIQ